MPFRRHYEDEEKEEHDPLWTFLLEDWTGTAESGKAQLTDHVGPEHGLDSVKPVELITIFVEALTSGSDIIMDFFAGSCTTSEAILTVNRHDGASRRFIMVQLPEPNGNPQFHTIAEIGKQRIRRVIENMQKEDEGKLLMERQMPEDLGFEVFKLTESNYRLWTRVSEDEPKAYSEQLTMFVESLFDGWMPEDVIYEVALKEGFSLSSKIHFVERISTAKVWRVVDNDKGQVLHICLDDNLNLKTIQELGLTIDDLFVCRDSALDDTTAANLVLQCRLKTI